MSTKRRNAKKSSLRERRLTKETTDLVNYLYNTGEKDPELRYHNLKEYRNEVLRGFVIYLHLALEDLLKQLLVEFLKQTTRSPKVRNLRRFVTGLRSTDILEWCLRLELVSKTQYVDLKTLNSIRNSCAHNWSIAIPKYKKIAVRRPALSKWKRTPTVLFRGKDLLNRRVFVDEFLPVYGPMHGKLPGILWRAQGLI